MLKMKTEENYSFFAIWSFISRKKNTAQTKKNICAIYGTIAERLRSGNFDLENQEHYDWFVIVGDDQMKMLI